ncbi:MAG: hypothetical protein ACPG06_10705 [Alphaproteobacteria bacterium]
MPETLYPPTPANASERENALRLLHQHLPDAPLDQLTPICWVRDRAVLAVHIGQVPNLKARMAAIYITPTDTPDIRIGLINQAAQLLEETLGSDPQNPIHGLVLHDASPLPQPATTPETEFRIFGFTQAGHALRVRWFAHPDAMKPPPMLGQMIPVWGRANPKATAAAIKMWEAENALPTRARAQDRAQDLVCVAMQHDTAVGAATMYLDRVEQLRARMAILRIFVADPARGAMLKSHLCLDAFHIAEEWGEQNPQEGVKGMVMVMENARAQARYQDMPRPTRTVRAERIGFDANGRIITIKWFKGAVIDGT